MSGLTVTLCIGSWARPHFRKHGRSIGFCIGWLAFTVYAYDREREMHRMLVQKGILHDPQYR